MEIYYSQAENLCHCLKGLLCQSVYIYTVNDSDDHF